MDKQISEDEITGDFPVPVIETIMVPVKVRIHYPDGIIIGFETPTIEDVERALKK